MPADAVAALDRPGPHRPSAADGEHLPVAVPVGAEPTAAEDILPLVEDLDRCRQLVRIYSDDDAAHAALLACRVLRTGEEGNASSSGTDPSRATHAAVPGQDARQKRATPAFGGQPRRERPARYLDLPCRAGHTDRKQEAAERLIRPCRLVLACLEICRRVDRPVILLPG